MAEFSPSGPPYPLGTNDSVFQTQREAMQENQVGDATQNIEGSEAESSTVSELINMPPVKVGIKLAPYNPTSSEAIEIAIGLLDITEGDIVFDLGCGDGRFLVQACEQHSSIKAFGVEYDNDLCIRANENVTASNLSSQVTIMHNNVLDVDISEATVLFIYLVPEGILKLKDVLLCALERGVRIVTYVFSIPGITPVSTVLYKKSVKIYLYKREEPTNPIKKSA